MRLYALKFGILYGILKGEGNISPTEKKQKISEVKASKTSTFFSLIDANCPRPDKKRVDRNKLALRAQKLSFSDFSCATEVSLCLYTLVQIDD